MAPPLTLCAYMKIGPNLRWSLIQCSGGDEGDRTPDLLTASQALSQLSYAPVRKSTIRELPRRCKDIFGKTFWGARGHASGDRDAPAPPEPARWRRHGRRHSSGAHPGPVRPSRGRHAAKPRHLLRPGARPRGGPPRNPPIYYLWAAPPDHTADGKTKTAGRRPAVFAKREAWSRGRVKK